MLNYAPEISFKGRFRIILLLVLSLCSCASYILPSSPGQGYLQESLLYENENPEACKLSLGIETAVRNKRIFSKQQFVRVFNTVIHNNNSHQYFRLAPWIRPAYYTFLYRFSLF
ncbi:hypothetical protein GFS24_03630 [Chitinophaga sp. SYP-B3965]|uniref:hypothetical protein n=1 Tax=Chitinophaga sp. SYP-B3965 TaxID=2663120 RepID=UPI001299F25B|nr:hypothetical protein [Chitinophaga sp. SYP-B3965]MRG44187.1 hypothetical protein [Chitinophaga sp. SYP-B3965]